LPDWKETNDEERERGALRKQLHRTGKKEKSEERGLIEQK
jgi:hypothetical protein